jgi:hypothetical protein
MLGTVGLADMGEDQLLTLAGERAETIREAEADLLRIAYQWALAHSPDRITSGDRPGEEQARLHGGDGTPQVCEFAAAHLVTRSERLRHFETISPAATTSAGGLLGATAARLLPGLAAGGLLLRRAALGRGLDIAREDCLLGAGSQVLVGHRGCPSGGGSVTSSDGGADEGTQPSLTWVVRPSVHSHVCTGVSCD